MSQLTDDEFTETWFANGPAWCTAVTSWSMAPQRDSQTEGKYFQLAMI